MGDYLSELATKNIGTADVIQPRRAARFEPVQTPGALDAQTERLLFQEEGFDIKQAIEEERAGEIKPDTRPPRSRRTGLSRKDGLISSRNDSDEQIPQRRLVSASKTQTPITKQTDEPVSIVSKMIEEAQETANEILSPPRLSSQTIVTPKKSLPTSADAQEETNITVEHAPVQPRSAPKAVELKIAETKSSEPQIIEKQNPEAQTPIIAKPRVSKAENYFEEATNNQTRILPPREKMSKQISESAVASDVPVINVTIGRVEVRAVTSSVTVKETRPKPPTLSLDEYLQQRRNGGGR